MIKFKYMKLPKSILLLSVLSLFPLFIISQEPGLYSMNKYLYALENKNIAMVVNHSSMIKNKHLVDTLLNLSVNIQMIFSPEHGFSGKFSAGEYVQDSLYRDSIPIVSLYAQNKILDDVYLNNIDVVIFDIQDVGVRFYTYLSTLHYVMESCAKNSIKLIVLDRPNPHVNYVDGPVLEIEYSSFVGMHPVPIVYGMTIGEYALMINGEGWLNDNRMVDLHIVKNSNYFRHSVFNLHTKPSPNLRTLNAILLYPSLCLFEGTIVSVGRGTEYPFEIYGAPFFTTSFSFMPTSNFGAKFPKYQNQLCYGFDLRNTLSNDQYPNQIDISHLMNAYRSTSLVDQPRFFNQFFNKLAGNSRLQDDIINNVSEHEIRASWQQDINAFLLLREKYLLYK